MGGHPGRDLRREQVGGTHYPPMRAFSRVYFPPQGAMGPLGLGSLGLGRLHERPGFPWALAHGSHGTQREERVLDLGGRDTAWERLRRG